MLLLQRDILLKENQLITQLEVNNMGFIASVPTFNT
jgi:hypothetical protein